MKKKKSKVKIKNYHDQDLAKLIAENTKLETFKKQVAYAFSDNDLFELLISSLDGTLLDLNGDLDLYKIDLVEFKKECKYTLNKSQMDKGTASHKKDIAKRKGNIKQLNKIIINLKDLQKEFNKKKSWFE